MIKKYNLAFIPNTISQEVVALAQSIKHLAKSYCLSASIIPHVTLYQFKVEEKLLPDIWNKSCKLVVPSIHLTFRHYSCQKWGRYDWVSLLPEEKESLYIQHENVAKIIEQPIRKDYFPHMTLINTTDVHYKNTVLKILPIKINLQNDFKLALGLCDRVGQLTDVLYVA